MASRPNAVNAPTPDSTTVASSALATFIILLVLFIVGVGNSFIFTSLPPIGREIGFSEASVGVIVAVGAAVYVLSSFLWGKWITRLGLRRSIQIGMATFLLTNALTGYVLALCIAGTLSPQVTLYLAIALRAIFAFGIGGIAPAAQAYFVFSSTAENRISALSNMSVAVTLGMISGPTLAAFLSAVSLVSPFYLSAALSLLAMFGVALVLPRMKPKFETVKSVKMIWKNHPVLPLLFLSMLIVFNAGGLQQVLLFYIQDMMALSAVEAAQRGGIAMTVMSIFAVSVQLGLVKRVSWPPRVLIYLGASLHIMAAVSLLAVQNYAGVIIGLSFFGAGTGLLFPAIASKQTLVSQDHEQGSIAGINGSAQGIGMAIGSLVCASLYTIGNILPFITIGVMAAIVALTYAYVRTKFSDTY